MCFGVVCGGVMFAGCYCGGVWREEERSLPIVLNALSLLSPVYQRICHFALALYVWVWGQTVAFGLVRLYEYVGFFCGQDAHKSNS